MTMLALIARRYRAWRRYETVLRELAQLTDRELADEGLGGWYYRGAKQCRTAFSRSSRSKSRSTCFGRISHCATMPRVAAINMIAQEWARMPESMSPCLMPLRIPSSYLATMAVLCF